MRKPSGAVTSPRPRPFLPHCDSAVPSLPPSLSRCGIVADRKVPGSNPTQRHLGRLVRARTGGSKPGDWPQGRELASLRRGGSAFKVAENPGSAVLVHESCAHCHSAICAQIAAQRGRPPALTCRQTMPPVGPALVHGSAPSLTVGAYQY